MKRTKYNRQPNKIILSRQEFSKTEKRIIYLIINCLKTGIDVNKDLFQNEEFFISVKEIGEINYHRLKYESDKLSKRRIKFIDKDGNDEFDIITPFPRVKYKDGILQVTMFADILPYFIELKRGFTTYQLQAALDLDSIYSQRMYELLSKFKDTRIWNFVQVEYLRQLLAVEDKYIKIAMFRKRILDTAKNELAEKTELSFKYEFHKTGRKYTHVTFYIHCKENKPKPRSLNEKQIRCLKHLQQFGINDKKLQGIILNEKQPEFWSWLFQYRQNKDNIQNPAGHLIKTLLPVK